MSLTSKSNSWTQLQHFTYPLQTLANTSRLFPARPLQDGTTGLISASSGDREAVARLLLEHKADVNAARQVPRVGPNAQLKTVIWAVSLQ